MSRHGRGRRGAKSPPPGEKPRGSQKSDLELAEQQLKTIGRLIKKRLPPDWGFLLALASFGDEGQATYLSSFTRATAIGFLREMATYLETGRTPGGLGYERSDSSMEQLFRRFVELLECPGLELSVNAEALVDEVTALEDARTLAEGLTLKYGAVLPVLIAQAKEILEVRGEADGDADRGDPAR